MPEFSLTAIALGGAFGSVSRFLVAQEMGHPLRDILTYGTLALNVHGSQTLDWLDTNFLDRPGIISALRLGIIVRFFMRLYHFFDFKL